MQHAVCMQGPLAAATFKSHRSLEVLIRLFQVPQAHLRKISKSGQKQLYDHHDRPFHWPTVALVADFYSLFSMGMPPLFRLEVVSTTPASKTTRPLMRFALFRWRLLWWQKTWQEECAPQVNNCRRIRDISRFLWSCSHCGWRGLRIDFARAIGVACSLSPDQEHRSLL